MGEEAQRQSFRDVRRGGDLESVLAGVAGARDQARRVEHPHLAHIQEVHRRDSGRERRQGRLGAGALKRDKGVREHLEGATIGKVCAQMVFVRLLAACIDDDHETIAEIGDHQIVADAA